METFYIQNVDSGLVVDIKKSLDEPGAQLIMFPYHGKPNQQWTKEGDAIKSKMNGLVLDVKESGGEGTPVITWNHTGGANQQWFSDPDGTIRNSSGLVLDVKKGSKESGAELIVWPKHGGANQKFRFVKC